LATSISATYLDVSDNQLTALPAEWTNGFTNATQFSFVNVFLEQNRIQVCFLLSTLSMNIWLLPSAGKLIAVLLVPCTLFIQCGFQVANVNALL
jgi:hypothetical protein